MEFEIKALNILSDDVVDFVRSSFRDYSIEKIKDDGGITPYHFVARNDMGILGVISGKLFYGSLQIKHLIVSKASRGRSIGTKLLEQALGFGYDNNCRLATVETLSFQALDFYKKNGFKEDFARDDYGLGLSLHYLSKKL